MIEFIKYILLGLLQGIAEVLPISSSGHLAIAGAIFSLQDDNLAFEVFLHLASLIAVLAFLIKPIIKLVKGCFLYVFKKNKDYAFEFKYLLFLIISTIPIVVFTIIMKLLGYDASPIYLIGICLIVNAIMLFFLTRFVGTRKKEEMTFLDALIIGLFQCAGMFPGISRSGSCLCGAFTRKIDKTDAADYAFMLFIPSVVGAFVLEAGNIGAIFTMDSKMIPCYIATFLVAAVTTYYAFKVLLAIIKKGKLSYFSIYCVIVGIFAIVYSGLNGWI